MGKNPAPCCYEIAGVLRIGLTIFSGVLRMGRTIFAGFARNSLWLPRAAGPRWAISHARDGPLQPGIDGTLLLDKALLDKALCYFALSVAARLRN